jgi:hypothetical protein
MNIDQTLLTEELVMQQSTLTPDFIPITLLIGPLLINSSKLIGGGTRRTREVDKR